MKIESSDEAKPRYYCLFSWLLAAQTAQFLVILQFIERWSNKY